MEKRTGAGPRVTREERVTKNGLGWTVRAWACPFLNVSLSGRCMSCWAVALVQCSKFAPRILMLQLAGHGRTTAGQGRAVTVWKDQTRAPGQADYSDALTLLVCCFTIPTLGNIRTYS